MYSWEAGKANFYSEPDKPNPSPMDPTQMDPALLDPNMYMQQYPPNTGLPQESKLASFMANRAPPPAANSLTQAMGSLSLETPTDPTKVLINEFVPMNYYAPLNMVPETQELPQAMAMALPPPPQVHQENVGGTTYFYTATPDPATAALNAGMMGAMCAPVAMSPYAVPMYAPAPMLGPLGPKSGLGTTYYMPEAIPDLARRSEMYAAQFEAEYSDLPEIVGIYAALKPLESPSHHSFSSSFIVTNRETATLHAMRRIHSNPGYSAKALEIWKTLEHPNIVKMQDYFLTKAFGDTSLVLIYEHHDGCKSLMQKYLSVEANTAEGGRPYHDPFSSDPNAPRPYTHQKNAMLRAVACGVLLPESMLWSMLIQLTAALRAIHNAGLACRHLDASKVIIKTNRVRISWGGIGDIAMTMIPALELSQAQQEDLRALGRMTLSLAIRTIHYDDLAAALDVVSRTYSADLKNVIMYLLSSTPGRRSVTDLMPMIGARFYTQVEALEKSSDGAEWDSASEADNGRLLRILVKLGLVNERPELNMDRSWSETGDRYLLKLFRDYLFHSVTPEGQPWIDQAHITHCLNQLDGGSPVKISLVSRDEQSMLVVTFSELKHCLEQAISELMDAGGLAESPSEENN